jgi:uncharacterized protein with FMN-binding domain
MAERRPVRKIANSLVTASGAVALAVYTAGYARTDSASRQFARSVAERRVASVSARVASVQDGLEAKVTLFPPGDLLGADRPAGAAPAAPKVWKDGTYSGWGFSPHGNIEATVAIEGGRIASAVISQCRTRYSCAVIDTLPPEVARRQSPNVDYISGATQNADAFFEAVVAALDKAR